MILKFVPSALQHYSKINVLFVPQSFLVCVFHVLLFGCTFKNLRWSKFLESSTTASPMIIWLFWGVKPHKSITLSACFYLPVL